MRKTTTKPKLFIATPSQKSVQSEPSPLNSSQKYDLRNVRNQNPRANLNKPDNLNSAVIHSQKTSVSKSPNNVSSKLAFLKNKLTIGLPRDSLLEENVLGHPRNKQESGSLHRLEKTEHTISSSSLNTSNNILTPRNKTIEITKEEENIIETKRPSPIHLKSNSLSRPQLTSSKYTLKSKRNLGHNKNHSVSSIECLSQSNFFSQNPSIVNSRIFNFNTKDMLDDSYDQLNTLKSVNLPDSERCANHPHKKAKYYVFSERDETEADNKYCSKCAIKLVAQGCQVQEILCSDEAMRKSELEEFLFKIVTCKKNINSFLSTLKKKREDLIVFFDRQEEKTESLYQSLETIIQEERKKNLEKLRNNKQDVIGQLDKVEEEATFQLSEMATMQGDIEKNIENILKNIGLEPFKAIMNQYETRVNSTEQELENYKIQQIIVHKLPNLNQKAIDKLRTHINVLYCPIRLTTSIIKKSEQSDEISRKTSSTDEDPHKLEKSSIYISFENKEIFENAMGSSDDSTRRCSEALYQLVNGGSGDLVSKIPNNQNGIAAALRLEDLKNPEPPLQDIMNKKTLKSPPEKVMGGCLSKTPQARGPKNLTVRFQTEEAEKFRDMDSPLKPLTDNYLENKENIPPKALDQSGGPHAQKSTKKYIHILDKISANQTKKGLYYSKIMKNNPLISPRYANIEDSEYETNYLGFSKSAKIEERSQEESMSGAVSGFQLKSPNRDKSKSMISQGTPVSSEQKFENPQKELKNYEDMVSFIENKIGDEKRAPLQQSFQKNLFCSPNFKENTKIFTPVPN